MTWKISWSWQAPSRIASILAVDEGIIVSSGLQLTYLDAAGKVTWTTNVPFKVHGMAAQSGNLGVLLAHGFYLYSLTTSKQITDGRSTPSGFKEIIARPGGGWVLSCRKGQLHLFSQEGRGIRRMESGSVRRLLGWLDREHLLWQDNDGIIWCGRLTGNDKKRMLEERTWSWISTLYDGRLLLQSSDGAVWEGVPHPFGWDKLECLETMSIEPMNSVRTGDGWWTLSLHGELHHLGNLEYDEHDQTSILGKDMELGDLLSNNVGDSMFTATREGLVRKWVAPHLFDVERQSRYKAAADAAMARNWEKRRQMFTRAQEAEDLGKVSLAIELYEALGRKEDVKRLLSRQKETISMIESDISEERLVHYLDLTRTAREKVSLISELSAEDHKKANVLLEMADAYIFDAGFFFEKGDYIRSFGAINYAHAWIDAGVKLKLLDGHDDDVLFTLP